MPDSSDEDFSDEEFDLEALRRARPFLSDDETEENLLLVGNDGKQVIFELLPISALKELEKQPQCPTEPTCVAKELNNIFGEKKKSDKHKLKLSESYCPNLLGLMRKRPSVCEKNEPLTAEEDTEDPNYYKKRLQKFRQRISTLKSNVLENRTTSLNKPGPSAPSTSHRTLRASPTLTHRSPGCLDISIPNWARHSGNSLSFRHQEETEEGHAHPGSFFTCSSFGFQSDESE